MAAVLRKRKIIDTGFGDAGNAVAAPQRQPRIQQFGRLSKPGIRQVDKKTETKATATTPIAAETKKRKLDHPEPKPEQQARPVTPPPPAAAPARKARLPPSQPGEPRRIAPLKKRARATVAESPTQGARAILEAFVLAAPTPKTPAERIEEESEGKVHSHELVALHAAFLNALSLHYAHEGTSTPADLRQLALSITRIWGRRRVTTEDIRRVLGVQQWKNDDRVDLPVLVLSDFGKGRLCIEFEPSETALSHSSPLPVTTLKRIFAGNLLALGQSELPLAPITPYAPTSITSSAKGAARLADLKASALNAQANTARSEGLGIKITTTAPPSISAVSRTEHKAASRGASLLERICAKEAHAAQQPAAPSAAAVARKAALQRLEEIIPVIEILASRNSSVAGGSASNAGTSAASMDLAASLGLAPRREIKTVSFTMPTLVQHLQNSLRHPLAKEEGELCVNLLAQELLPRWVQVHTLNKWTSVSVRGSVRRGEWVERLRELEEEEED